MNKAIMTIPIIFLLSFSLAFGTPKNTWNTPGQFSYSNYDDSPAPIQGLVVVGRAIGNFVIGAWQGAVDWTEHVFEVFFPLPTFEEFYNIQTYDPTIDVWDDPSGYFGQTMQEGYGAPEFPIAALVLPLALIPIVIISRRLNK
jgi:hypothetical protein